EREDVGRGVAGERMEPLRRDALEQLHTLDGRARVQVRPCVEDLARAIDEHATLALAGGGHAQDARAGGEPRHHRTHRARERTPERLGVEVEAAQEGEARIAEEGVAERLLSARQRPAGEVEGDRAPRTGAGVERDQDVGHARQTRRSSTAGFATQRGRSPRRWRSMASTTISLWWRVTSTVAPPMCGVTITLGSARKRLSGWSGSSASTSSAAPASRPSRSIA